MKIKEFDNDEYIKFIEALTSETAIKIISAKDQIDATQKAIWEYVDIGYSAGLSSEEVIDFFCVSSDSVVDRIPNLKNEDREMIVYIFDRINCALFPKFFPENAG